MYINAMEEAIPQGLTMSRDSEFVEPLDHVSCCAETVNYCCCIWLHGALMAIDCASECTTAEWPDRVRQKMLDCYFGAKRSQELRELLKETLGMRESPYID